MRPSPPHSRSIPSCSSSIYHHARIDENVDSLIVIMPRLRRTHPVKPIFQWFIELCGYVRVWMLAAMRLLLGAGRWKGVVGISDIIVKPGLINVDFADVR